MCLHYLVKLITRVWSPYITYFSIQVVDFWHQIFTNCWNNSFQQSTTVFVVFTDMENHAEEGLQEEEDCKCWRTSLAHRGRVGTSWSVHYRRRSERVTKRLRACAAAEGGQFEHELWLLAQQCCCNCALWLCRSIVWLLITFAVTVFSVRWLFQSHAAVMKRYGDKTRAISFTR